MVDKKEKSWRFFTGLPYLQVFMHCAVWVLLFMLNYFIVSNYPVTFRTGFHVKIWLIYIAMFYINLLLLMPYFLFRKKILFYLLFSVILIVAANYLRVDIERKYFREEIVMRRSPERPPPRFGSPGPMPDKSLRRFIFPFFGRGMVSFYGILLMFATSTSIGLIFKWQESEKKRTETEKEKLFAELSYLKKQVNPHFLFNALNNIYSLSLNKSGKTTQAVLKLSSILRYMLYESNKKQVSLKSEIETINDYIELQKLRFTDKVTVIFELIGDPSDFQIEPLLLLPVIENAFKFGADNINPSAIHILLKIDEWLDVKIVNNIVQRTDKSNDDCGIGMSNIKRRLELLYPEDHMFTYGEENDVFTVHLSFKLKR